MWAFIFVILLGVLLFNTIIVEEKKSEGFSIVKALNEANQTKEANSSLSINLELQQTIIEDSNQTFLDKIITLAQSKLGSPYIYADTGPDSFDCSGFVYYLFKEQNISIPRTSLAQSKGGNEINRTQIQRGDMVFFDTSNKGHVNHSGIYLGEDKFIHASSGKAKGVTISELNGWYKDKFLWGIHTKELNLSNSLQNFRDHQTPKSTQDIP
jgi:cell wall-associated NlpC family hydrolase